MIVFNGVDGVTGLARPPATAEFLQTIRGARPPRPSLLARAWGAVARVAAGLAERGPHLGLPFDVDPAVVKSAGWAVVLAHDLPPAARAAAARLYEHRLRHTKVKADRCKLLDYPAGARLQDWLRSGPVRAHLADVLPTRLPYYILFVGQPTAIPFEVQTTLAGHYAVGRLAFDDPAGYDRYVDGLIEYETGAARPRAREVVYYAVRSPEDEATRLAADHLVRPLYAGHPDEGNPVARTAKFGARLLDGATATRPALLGVLHAARPADRPAVVFTASHGLGWPTAHPRQRADQGALVCGEWPGAGVAPAADHCVRAADVGGDATPHGLVAVLFGCHTAGTPAADIFPVDPTAGPVRVAEGPFVAALPQRLLGHPGGGALAVVGHVGPTYESSIVPAELSPRTLAFRNLLGRVLRGEPVGHATRDFGERFDAANRLLTQALAPADPGPRPTADQVIEAWFERNDAQYYVTLGDPAAQLNEALLLQPG